jgi:hypothetical protein
MHAVAARRRALRLPALGRLRPFALVLAMAFIALRWWSYVTWPDADPFIHVDFEAYLHGQYGGAVGPGGSYLYSPAFAQLLAPLRAVPFDIGWGLWTALSLACLVYLLGPTWAAAALLLPPVDMNLFSGQIHLMLAAAVVAGLRHPSAWALPLLTKVTPGIGLVWFAARREWRQLAIGTGVTLAIIVASGVLDPASWAAWFGVLRGGGADPSWTALLVARGVVALLLVGYGAWRSIPAAVPVACFLAMPIPWVDSLVLLLAVPRLLPPISALLPSRKLVALPIGEDQPPMEPISIESPGVTASTRP